MMTTVKTIQTTEATINYGDVSIIVNAPVITADTIITTKDINALIKGIEKTGVVIINTEVISNQFIIEDLLAGLQQAVDFNCYCYICDINRNGLYHYSEWRVMLHSRRLPR